MTQHGGVQLAEFIRELRSELQAAVEAAEGQPLRFELGPVELELGLAVEKRGETTASVKFWVVGLAGGGELSHQSTQRVRLTLHPMLAATGRPPRVAGVEAPGER